MTKQSVIAKVCWDSRKSFRGWQPDNVIKKWNTADRADKDNLLQAVEARMKGDAVLTVPGWTEDEVTLMNAIVGVLKDMAI